MQPAYDISMGGTSLFSRIESRAVAITITDSAGSESDSLSLEIDAGDKLVELPRKGAKLSVSLGYAYVGLTPMGLYVVDEVKLLGPPCKLSITAKSADMRASLKQHRTGQYEKKSIGDIVGEIAGRHGLSAAVEKSLAARKITWLGQTEESDLHLLTRLARAHGAIAAPKNGKLVFAKRGSGTSASGTALPSFTLAPSDVTDFNFTLPDRPRNKEVVANWHDKGKAKRQEKRVAAGGEESAFTLRHDFPSEDEAQWAAEAKRDELKRASGSFSATLPGRPQIAAECVLITKGFYPGLDLTWTVATVTHALSGDSFTTSVDCEVKS